MYFFHQAIACEPLEIVILIWRVMTMKNFLLWLCVLLDIRVMKTASLPDFIFNACFMVHDCQDPNSILPIPADDSVPATVI